jgi:DNA-directed RNA polymerase subunit RPC12/RpoP
MSKNKTPRKKYELFMCRDCWNVIGYPIGLGDGRRCPVCGSGLRIIMGTYKQE